MAGVKGRSGGRNAKTVDELKAQGTFDPSRHAGIENPQPPEGRPKPPGKLGKVARREWNRMLGWLETARILSTVDAAPLYQYCQLFAETEAVAAQAQQNSALIDKLKGTLNTLNGESLVEAITQITRLAGFQVKYTTQIRQGRMALRVYLVEFGLTPAARSRVKVIGGAATKDTSEQTPLQKLQSAHRHLRAV